MSFQFLDLARLTRKETEPRSNRMRNLANSKIQESVPENRYADQKPLQPAQGDDDDLRGNMRRNVQIHAEIRESGGGRYDTWVSDISQTGFRMQLLCQLDSNRGILLILPGMKPLRARIAWREGNYYGCMFENPLHIAVFEHISRQFEGH